VSKTEQVASARIISPTDGSTRTLQRTRVSSSNILAVGYDPAEKILEIEFHSGSVYQYFEVPASQYQGLLGARSKGRYFSRYIKNRYRFQRID